jgi:lysophospholipase L1-like esterase
MSSATDVELHSTNVASLVINGVEMGVVKQMKIGVESATTTKKYVEIGDSISWQYDGKLENFASEGSSTGYKAVGGYGQKICKKFGISYVNHASHGLNGRTFTQYMNEITTTTSTDLVFKVPKDGDIYTIFLGTNDFGKAIPLGTELDFLNATFNPATNANPTIYGGIRAMVDYITDTSTTTKNKKIVFITPIGFGAYKGYGTITSTWMKDSNGKIVERANSVGVKMSDIVSAIKFAADQIGAYVIDLYGQQGLVQKNRLNIDLAVDGSGNPLVYQSVLGDNLHPNTLGHNWLGNFICNEIDKIIVTDSF